MIINKPNIKFEYKSILSIAFFAFAIILLIRWNGNSGENYRNIIRSDGYGYYDYFPMLFGEKPISEQEANGIYLLKTTDGKVVNKYFVGTALLQSPFVLTVAIAKSFAAKPIDFHSEIFQKTISIAALFYLLFGLIALSKLLRLYNIDKHLIEFSLFAVFFGTNLLYYSVMDPSMSHVYSFAMISGFLLSAKKLSIDFTPKNLILTTLFIALVVLIRPVNILIILFFPFITGSLSKFFELITSKFKLLYYSILSVFIFFIILSLQLFIWKAQTGDFIVWSYANEGFYFYNPAICDFLFSFRKGLFVYTPFVLVSLIIFLVSKRKNPEQLILSLGFLTILVYVLSSWWNWYYGDSFGSRVFIDFLPVITILLAIGLSNSKIIFQRISVILISIFFILNLAQTYQYYHNIMSHFDMNGEKYRYILGKFGQEYENSLGGNDDIVSYHKEPLVEFVNYDINFEENNYKYFNCSLQNIDYKTVRFNKDEYGLSFIFLADSFFKYRESYLELQNSTTLKIGNLDNTFWTITYLDSAKNIYNYQKIKINGIPATIDKKRQDVYHIRLPKPMHANDMIQISIWNLSHAEFELSNLKVKIAGIIE